MIAIIIALLIIIYSAIPLFKWYKKRAAIVKAIDQIPGSKAYPIVGTTYQIFGVERKNIFKTFHRIFSRYPYIARSWIGFRPEVNIRKAEYIEKVINANKNMQKTFGYDYVKVWLGDGLLISTGDKWHKHRKIITPTFHFSILESFCEIFAEKSKILVDELSRHADSGVAINIHRYVTLAALDTISESAMGIKIDCQRKQENEYVDAVYEISELIKHRMYRPYLAMDIIYRNTSAGKKFKRCVNILHNFTKHVISKRKALREENRRNGVFPKKRQAFLDLLLDANQKENLLSDEEIREEVDTFMFEGHDTTAAGISWTLYILGLYPNVQQLVFEETEHIFNGSDRPATLADFNEMKYLERVIKETMRLYPPVPVYSRILSEDVQLDQYTVPKGTMVTMGIYYLHRDTRFFPDPEKFDPDRFLPENAAARHPYAYLPFSAGPRNCVGQKFAMYEEKSVLSSIIRNYKVTSVEKRDEINLIAELILRSYEGINVKLERRVK
ncbi:Cytochrome P450 4C1 [Pseudolycoriella hygida]|uniref:Cytochrome P450 4C1 n=1 Tax=Pseudolycoriella hygida TaxID=35572 RepID=A0A9Q0NHS7_9DIPT|nr:Cytochrome P450 4C1 [Pseudolycoriella hygida]